MPSPLLFADDEHPGRTDPMDPETRRILRALQWFVAVGSLLLGYYGYTCWHG